jgi:23S rRNA (guanosine2251-2'-O)-methyltransferase
MKKLKLEELGRITPEKFRDKEKFPVCVVLDNIRSLHNVGSVFRSADAFCVDKLWLCGYTPQPPNREIRKTAIGAEETVAWEYAADAVALAKQLKADGWKLVVVEQTDASVSLPDFHAANGARIALVLGNEVDGVQAGIVDLCDAAVEIPQFGTKHSLNVSVAAGIVLYEVVKGMV